MKRQIDSSLITIKQLKNTNKEIVLENNKFKSLSKCKLQNQYEKVNDKVSIPPLCFDKQFSNILNSEIIPEI